MICLKIMSCSCHLGRLWFDPVNTFLFHPLNMMEKKLPRFWFYFLWSSLWTGFGVSGKGKGWSENTVSRRGWCDGIGRGCLVWHQTPQHSYSGWWCFLRGGLEAGHHKIAQSLSVCFITGIFLTLSSSDWHNMKYSVSDMLISLDCKHL